MVPCQTNFSQQLITPPSMLWPVSSFRRKRLPVLIDDLHEANE